jgi:hypothetical protein
MDDPPEEERPLPDHTIHDDPARWPFVATVVLVLVLVVAGLAIGAWRASVG